MPTKAEFIKKIGDFSPDVIGFSMRTTATPFVTEFAGWLDDSEEYSDIPVGIGGYHAILVPDDCLAIRGVDFVIVGEGEYPWLELIDNGQWTIDNGKIPPKTDIESINFKLSDGTVVKNPVRPLIEDLDTLPFPDFELFDFTNLDRSKNFTAMVMLSRGCLFSCTYCGNSQFRNIYPNKKKFTRFRSPAKAIEMLQL